MRRANGYQGNGVREDKSCSKSKSFLAEEFPYDNRHLLFKLRICAFTVGVTTFGIPRDLINPYYPHGEIFAIDTGDIAQRWAPVNDNFQA